MKNNFRKSNSSKSSDNWVWGRHSVEALVQEKPELLEEVFFEKKSEFSDEDKSLERLLSEVGLRANKVIKLPKLLSDRRHQGWAAKIKSFPVLTLEEYMPSFESDLKSQSGFPSKRAQFLLLDRIQDVHNFGAILRSAAAFGVKAVFVMARQRAPMNGVVAQVSAGQAFRVPVVECVSFNPVLRQAENSNAQTMALDSGGTEMAALLKSEALADSPLLWLLGAEGKGLRPSLVDKADHHVSVQIDPRVESLNASNAAALAIFAGSQIC